MMESRRPLVAQVIHFRATRRRLGMLFFKRLSAHSAMLTACIGLATLANCSGGVSEPGPEATPESVLATERAGVPSPVGNPTNPAKVELGRLLFWDPILSGNRDVACSSCHDPAFGYSDGRAVSLGTAGNHTKRGALTVLDAAWNGWTALTPKPDAAQAPMFWDNRARSLEAQARGPIVSDVEMLGSRFSEATIFPELVRRLTAIPEYVVRFKEAFAEEPISETTILAAIACFERGIVTVPSYERWLAGDETAISASAKRGVTQFRDNGCSRCHSGPMLSDFELHRFPRSAT
jgi:cytochrome c peroxidase